jgi:hypothetical protein
MGRSVRAIRLYGSGLTFVSAVLLDASLIAHLAARSITRPRRSGPMSPSLNSTRCFWNRGGHEEALRTSKLQFDRADFRGEQISRFGRISKNWWYFWWYGCLPQYRASAVCIRNLEPTGRFELPTCCLQ